MRSILAFLAVLALTWPAASRAEGPRVEILDYGTYATGTRKTVPMPISVSGTMNIVANVRLIKKTQEVMGQLGTSFGFRYRVHGVPAGATVTIRTRHPRLTNPETGKSMNYAERDQSVSPGEERYTGYSFDSTYEIGEGEWTFQIIYQGRVIGEQKFKIVVPIN
ncbi:MAG: DUF3859 domain-containing protein [Rhodospirillaceae bacterium]|nr:DUF3859 domain-containing protein [Rhodospirillaceae bacterium]